MKNKQVYKGVRWSALQLGAEGGIQALQLVVLARFLTPHDFGLIALLLIVFRFSRVVGNAGISQGIIHKQEIDRTQLSTLFWINIIFGAAVFLGLCGCAPLIARYFDESSLTGLIILNSVSFLFIPLGTQYRALFQKHLDFKTTAVIDIAAAAAGFLVTLGLVLGDFGVYGVVAGNVVNISVAAVMLFILGGRYHRPAFSFALSGVRDVLSFGSFHLGFRVVTLLNSEIDSLIIGKLLGVEALGVYSLAKRLVKQPAQLVEPISTKVSFAVMARLQGDRTALAHAYRRLVGIVSALNLPLYVFMFLAAESIVLIMLGSSWSEVVVLMQVLCCWGLFRSLALPIRPLILATGAVRARLWRSLCFTLVLAAAIYAGATHSLLGVAVALAVVTALGFFVSWYIFPRVLTGTTLTETWAALKIPALISVAAGIGYHPLTYQVIGNELVAFAVFSGLFGATYLLATRKFNRGFFDDMRKTVGR